jgi:hypothetical protein
MSLRTTLFAAILTFTALDAAHADGPRATEAIRIDLGEVTGVAYYTVERDGFHIVTTLAQGESGTPVRFVSVLTPGQSVILSTSQEATALEISREGDGVVVRKTTAATN